jgi:hypothetical protein
LPDIQRIVNTTRPTTLPKGITLYKVWFGRKPHWLNKILLNSSNNLINVNGNQLSDTEYASETDIDCKEYILTALEHDIRKNNTKVAARIVKKAGKKARTFDKGSLVTLAIPSKLRLHTEPRRLLCRVVKVVKHQYTLITAKGLLSGSHSASALNSVSTPNQFLVPQSWPGNTKKLTLTKAVQLTNNRGTIAQAQKAGRRRTQGSEHPVETLEELEATEQAIEVPVEQGRQQALPEKVQKVLRRSGRKVQKRVLE